MAIHPWGKLFISAGDFAPIDAQTSALAKCNSDPAWSFDCRTQNVKPRREIILYYMVPCDTLLEMCWSNSGTRTPEEQRLRSYAGTSS